MSDEQDVRIQICEQLLKCMTMGKDVGAPDWLALVSMLSVERTGRYEQIKRQAQEIVMLRKRVEELEIGGGDE